AFFVVGVRGCRASAKPARPPVPDRAGARPGGRPGSIPVALGGGRKITSRLVVPDQSAGRREVGEDARPGRRKGSLRQAKPGTGGGKRGGSWRQGRRGPGGVEGRWSHEGRRAPPVCYSARLGGDTGAKPATQGQPGRPPGKYFRRCIE